MNRQGLLYTVIVTFIISFAFIFILALTNSAVSGQIAKNLNIDQQKAVLSAMGIAFQGNEQAYELYNKNISVQKIKGTDVYTSVRNGETFYAIIAQGPGLWSTITAVIAVNKKVTKIIGIAILSQEETPGLGGRIDEAWFKNQFRNKSLTSQGTITVGSPTADTGQAGVVDGITAASQTSRLFGVIVNNALTLLRKLLGAG
jgi:Na+-transporting NADH:ubiquinone oxidoreductase subunit C